jgi:sterol desaturase/sphingolipid hydroxylase (fatty acid hydroxylase superfamily)
MRYGSRNFRIDLLYYVFYYGGIYQILIYTWLYKALSHLVTGYAPWLRMELLSGMSPAMQIVTLIFAADFFGYWSHRLRHAHRFLWAFHAIHHSQTILTPMANYRFHFVDETVLRLCLFIPFTMLGTGVTIWLAVDVFMAWILLLQHSEWDWTYGPLGRVFVSPVFHRIHHAKEEQLQNSNYAMLFSFWDDLFGTAERKAPAPAEHGIAGNPVPETLLGQFIYPFVAITRDLRRSVPAAVPVVPPRQTVAE